MKAYERREELANCAVGQYRSLLEQSRALRAYSKESLLALAMRICVPL